MKRNRTYRIRTGVNDGTPVISFAIDSSIETYEILSLKINQVNAYRLMSSDKGVITGRVLANNGFGIPNARVSVFVHYEDTDDLEKKLLYPYSSARSVDGNGVRYNLLPSESDDDCHQTVGTFPNKRMMLDEDAWIDIFDKYYRYTTRTNASGDYMIYGVPTGQQTVHMDVDLSDIGPLSQKPRDMMAQGYSAGMFENPNKFKGGANLGSLVQIKSQDSSVYVYPFWGDTTDTQTNAAITRHDISVNYTFKPTCVFMGGVISDTGENSMSKKCVGAKNQGKMSEMMTGEGKIEMIRKTFDGNVEEFSVQGNQLINGDGVWCYQIPMNLDYVMTDEYGNTVLSDNPEKGIPTRARVRFRISMSESPNDGTARKRARYLVPNNPHLIEEDYPSFWKDRKPDYEFGTNTKDENFRDLMWNNVYTVKSYIPRIQKSNLPNNLRHLGIKTVNHPGGHNPMPFNNLRIRMNFTYRFMCALIKILVTLVGGVNRMISLVNYGLFKIAQGFLAITRFFKIRSLGSFWGKRDNGVNEKYFTINPYKKNDSNPYAPYIDNNDNEDRLQDNDDDSEDDDTTVSYRGAVAMLGIIGQIANQQPQDSDTGKFRYILDQIGGNPQTTDNGKKIGVKGFAAFMLAIVHQISCGITLNSLCEDENGDEISATPGTIKKLSEIFDDVNEHIKIGAVDNCNTDVAALYNCVENELAQDNEVTSFNFYNDWINGVLYFPLWYRKIKPKRRFFGIRFKAKDQWCSADTSWIRASADRRQLKVYDTCTMKMEFDRNASTPMGETIKPIEDSWDTVDVEHSRADDETGIEAVKFNSYEERNCYGYRCDKYARSYMPMRSGLMQERETMLGDLVYYYKPCEYNAKYTSDLITLFATDIVLLGSLSDCDIHGVPQFFKALESTTYNMPPDLMTDVYEYKTDISDYQEDRDSQFIDESTRETEYTGADWGNLGVDQTAMRPLNGGYVPVPGVILPATAMHVDYETNENIYDNGGLFYGLTCFNAFTKPKSCINLSRICEFGVSLDESQEILSTQSLSANPDNPDDSMYSTLTPDGFISYDEIYDMDYRSMFATLNANLLRTKLNYSTGLTEYDFNHLYVDNFDGVMSELMKSPSTTEGWTEISNYTQRANYIGNHNLEKSSDSYLNFRFGNYQKADGNRLYYYDHDASIGKVGPANARQSIRSADRMPRYENSFYFYFGLNEGKTAIDSFYTLYYSDCTNDAKLPQKYEIGATANSVCPQGTLDGRISFSFNAQPAYSISITNADNSLESYHVENMGVHEFYIGTVADQSELPGYVHARLYEDATGEEIPFLSNGTYNIVIQTGDDEELHETVSVLPPQINAVSDVTDFTLKNSELDETFQHLNQDGSYDWGPMFQEIASFKDTHQDPIVRPDGSVNRLIGGYVKIGQASIENCTVSIEPASVSFFSDGDGHMLYTAPQATVLGQNVTGSGDGYLGNDGTDVYFGVPYGNQKYIITVTELCYDSEDNDNQIVTTSNTTSWTVVVRDGDFKMYVNGIDSDILKSFRTGWSPGLLNPPSGPTFDASDIYGWDDLDNIGMYYNAASGTAEPVRAVTDADSMEALMAIGDALSYEYDGNGAPHMVEGADCSTPYSWNEMYCIPADEWDSVRSGLEGGRSVIYNEYDAESDTWTDTVISDVTVEAFMHVDGYKAARYFCTVDGIRTLACTEHPVGSLSYEEGFSDLQGPTMYSVSQAMDMVNNIVEARSEFAKMVEGSFRTGYNNTQISVSYRSTATPIEYLMAGGNEVSGFRDVFDQTNPSGQPIINPNNPRVVFDQNLETNVVTFALPTLVYNSQSDTYTPYSSQSGLQSVEKIPYYVAIRNSLGIAIPGGSSSVGPMATARMVDNFGANKSNPITNAMLGVHFFDSPLYARLTRVVSLFNAMPKYGSHNLAPVSADALVISCAMNGMPTVTAKLDGMVGLVAISSTGQTEGYQRCDIRRLMYNGSDIYGKYQVSPEYLDADDNPIEYQYFTIPRNRVLSLSDGYGPGYEAPIVCDYTYNTSAIDLSNATIPELSIPMSFSRSFPTGVKYHVFRYDGTNHPTDYAVQDQSTQEWSFTDSGGTGAMNAMFQPGYDFQNHGGHVYTIDTLENRNSSPAYRFAPQESGKANPMFVVAEDITSGTLAFSPVIEMAHMISVHNFSNWGGTQNGYTLYLLRRPVAGQSDYIRPGCDITDFKYLVADNFDLSFKYGESDGSVTTVVSYTVDPTDSEYCSIVNITVTDQLAGRPDYVTSGQALRVQVDRIPGFNPNDFGGASELPTWYMVWTSDSIGVERRCVGTITNENGTVTVTEQQ